MVTFHEAPEGNAAAGAKLFKAKCATCHGIEKGGSSWLGPNLHGLFGRQAGTLEGYSYSAATKAKGAEGLIWKEDTIYEYICNPRAYIPGSKKVFAGVKKPQDRADLIAYLKKATA